MKSSYRDRKVSFAALLWILLNWIAMVLRNSHMDNMKSCSENLDYFRNVSFAHKMHDLIKLKKGLFN